MLERILGFFKGLTSKKVIRSVFLAASIVSIAVGYATLDGFSVVYRDEFRHINTTMDAASTTVDTNDIVENVESEDVEDAPLLGMFSSTEYVMNPVTVTTTEEVVTETIKHGYKKVYSDKLYKGETKITDGEHGEKKVTYSVVTLNGIEVSREVVEEVVIKEAVSQVETIGTLRRPGDPIKTSEDVNAISTLKPKEPIALDANGKPVNYTKVITGKATAYCNHCDGNSTAYYGKNSARPGYIAVNPKMIPYGTKLYIVTPDGKRTYGYAVAADTGGFAKKNPQKTIADLRMYFSGDKCLCGSYWGRRNVEIYVLK